MEGKFFEPINLLVIAENDTLKNSFIGELKGFLQDEQDDDYKHRYKQPYRAEADKTTFRGLFRDFSIISCPVLSRSDTWEEISSKLRGFQDLFNKPLHLNAIIIVMRPDSKCYEQFLSLNLFKNFCKDDMAKIEKNVMFIFVHNDPESYQKRDMVDVNLWTVLDRIGANLLHSKTFHYNSCLNKDCQEAVLQFVYRIKRTLVIKTVHSHESVLKVIGNEGILDLLMDALFVNEDNLHYKRSGEKKEYYFRIYDSYQTMCTNKRCWSEICCSCSNVKTKYLLEKCNALINKSTCTTCKCSIKHHKAAFYTKDEGIIYEAKNRTGYRHVLITMIVIIDLFHKGSNASVGQLYEIMKERIKQETRYSVLEELYKSKRDNHQKEITADDCVKCILSCLPYLHNDILNAIEKALMLAGRHLRVKD